MDISVQFAIFNKCLPLNSRSCTNARSDALWVLSNKTPGRGRNLMDTPKLVLCSVGVDYNALCYLSINLGIKEICY